MRLIAPGRRKRDLRRRRRRARKERRRRVAAPVLGRRITPARDTSPGLEALLPVVWTTHAIERYRERIRDLDTDHVRAELDRLLDHATVTAAPPEWAEPTSEAVAWLIAGDIACPLVRDGPTLVAATLLVRGGIGDTYRQNVNETKARRRASKRQLRRDRRWEGKRPRPIDDGWEAA